MRIPRARRRSRGRRRPSTSGPSSSYGTPLGLIAITPAARSTALALPKVRTTRPASHDPPVRLEDPLAQLVERPSAASHGLEVRLVPAQLPWRSRRMRVSASITSSSMPAISAKSANASRPIARQNAVWCGPPATSHASAAVARSGRGRQTARATGSRGSSSSGSTTSTSFATSRKRSPRSSRPTTTAGPGAGGEDQPHRIVLAADRQRVDLARRLPAGDRRADLEHVRAEHLRPVGRQVVRVVLHERRAAREAGAHHLDDADERRGLPVALGAEAVAVGHQPLDGDAGQLGKLAEVLERVGEGPEAAGLEERAQAGLDPGRVAQGLVPLAVRAKRRREVVLVGVARRRAPRRPRRERPGPRRRARRPRSRSPRRRAGSAPRPCRPR